MRQSDLGFGEDSPCGVFVLRVDLIPAETWATCCSVARVVLVDSAAACSISSIGTAEPLSSITRAPQPAGDRPTSELGRGPRRPRKTGLFNGLGGFADDGREYDGPWPGPEHAGTLDQRRSPTRISASRWPTEGSGYTWSANSRENQLTPWSNDPVTDRPGEALYLCDDDTGDLWSPTALPIRIEAAIYLARHGQGYSRFEHTAYGVGLELLEFVPLDGSDQDFATETAERRAASGSSHRDRLCGMGAGPRPASPAAFRDDIVLDFRSARFSRKSLERAFGARVAFADLGGDRPPGPAIAGSSSAGTGRLGGPRRWSAAPHSRALLGAGPGSMRRTAAAPRPGAGRQRRNRLPPRGSPGFAGGAGLIERYRDLDLKPVFANVASTGASSWSPSR